MAVERIELLEIVNRGFVTALIGNLADSFIDDDLKIYNFKQQLFEYLKSKGYKTIVFYDRNDGLFTYEESSFQNFLGKAATSDNDKPSSNNQDGRPINGRFKRKTEQENTGSDKLYKWRPTLGFFQIEGTSDTALMDKFKAILRQTEVKTVLIFNSPEIQITNRDEFITSISTVYQEYSTARSQNKILINYTFENEAELVRYFNTKHTIFADNFFRDLFISGDAANKVNVFKVPLPMQDECRNLLNMIRLKDSKNVDWPNWNNNIEMLVAENRTLKENESKLSDISELTMEALIKNNVIKPKTIDFDRRKMQPVLNEVKGQDENIEIIAEDIELWASEESREKPLSFFLVGKSGTGKTHTAETFAKALEPSGFGFRRLDMTEYKEQHSIAKITGAPPGFVGYDDTPVLIQAIKENRRMVFLFDEIEEAHPDILTALMNLIDVGRLTHKDYTGNFTECILFFTSNLAEDRVVQTRKDFLINNKKGNKTAVEILKDSKLKDIIREILYKERPMVKEAVWNRFGYYLVYNQLDPKYIVEIIISIIRKTARQKNIIINEIAIDYLTYLTDKQQNSKSGLRDLEKEIEPAIKKQRCTQNSIYNVTFDIENERINIVKCQTCESSNEDEKLVNETLAKYHKLKTTTKKYDWDVLLKSLNDIYSQQDNTELIFKEVKSWLRAPSKKKPLVFLLAGTSGTGKTFTAKKIAEGIRSFGYIDEIFNMNEYSNSADVWRFLGSTTGHVGSEETPKIFALREKSDKMVLVFDEIEKAHEKLLLAMMTLLDEGILSNGHGTSFDFKNSIIFLTSNLAMDELLATKKRLLQQGYTIDTNEFQDETKKVLKNNGIRTEISRRFDWLLVYNTLDAKNVAKIALQEIRQLAKEYKIMINTVDHTILSEIANACKDNNEGAGPVCRNVSKDFTSIFQDFAESNIIVDNSIFDVDQNKNLIESHHHQLTIDEVVDKISFDETQPVKESVKTVHLTLPSKPFFEKDCSIDSYAKALGLIKIEDGKNGEGTGFLISQNGYIITCAHCVLSGKKISFCFNNEAIEASLVYKNDEIDIAIIKIEKNDLPFFVISESTRGLKRGTQMGLLAFPKGSTLGVQPSFTQGAIAKCEGGMYFTDANATYGSSGGAFFLMETGTVYGVLKGGYGQEGANLNVATDILLLFKQKDIEIEFE